MNTDRGGESLFGPCETSTERSGEFDKEYFKMNLKQIEAFVKISNNKSFSVTAKEMYLTQPTVSAAIRTLEDELGIPLFIRNTRGVELTEAGKQIYLYANQMLEASSAIYMISSDNAGKGSVTHELVIASSSIPSQFLLPEIMADYSVRYPETQFRVRVSDSGRVAREIEEHKADIGLCGTKPQGKGLVCIPFFSDELVIVTPNTEKYQKLKNEESVDWIKKEPVILREDGSGTKAEALAYLKSIGIDDADLNIAVRMGNSSAILKAVKKGLGITFLSHLAASEEIEAGNLLEIPMSGSGYRRSINIIYNQMFPQSESVKRFIRFVCKQYKADTAGNGKGIDPS